MIGELVPVIEELLVSLPTPAHSKLPREEQLWLKPRDSGVVDVAESSITTMEIL